MGAHVLGIFAEKGLKPEARRASTQERDWLEGKGMRETEEKRGWAENKPVGREKLGRVHDEVDPYRGAEDLLIEDYVVWDFDLPKEEDRDNGIRT